MELTRVFDLLENYSTNFGDKQDALAGKVNGEWVKWSFEKFKSHAHLLASGLIAEGIVPGDRVAILSNNRPEWNIVDFASQLAGAISVPVYPTISVGELAFILTDSESKIVFVSSNEIYLKTLLAIKDFAIKPKVYVFELVADAKNWEELIAVGTSNNHSDKISAVKQNTSPDDVFTILYTSGTTGTPKGVMLMHKNLVSNFTAISGLCPVDHTHLALSFLPLNHVYERMISFLYLYRGLSIYYAESLETIGANILELKPHIFSCVPSLLQKVYNRITAKGADLTGVKRKLFFWSLRVAEKFDVGPNAPGLFYKIKLGIASKLIFSKWREALGGNVRCMVSGGAALDQRLARIFWAAGIPVIEGYGLTETSPVIAVSTFDPNGLRFGTVGPLIKDVEVKIAEDGEILFKGPNLMKGYYKRPEDTAEVIDSSGWFHTGDIGEFIENRFLKITDRKKEIFKTTGGKYIAPQRIENLLKSSRFIEQSITVGDNRKFPTALIVPAFVFVRDWAKRKGIELGTTNEELIENPEVIKRINVTISKLNTTLAQYEKIKKITLLPKLWTIESGELTPKLSLKRRVILTANQELIEKMYGE
ncbi:MAG: long-chain fatty acid--CoA ligase [Flavobacteriales bacterium]|nr:MAG: long-chain fatty acid--CoA ligase [Flavobacteriales bacterium]